MVPSEELQGRWFVQRPLRFGLRVQMVPPKESPQCACLPGSTSAAARAVRDLRAQDRRHPRGLRTAARGSRTITGILVTPDPIAHRTVSVNRAERLIGALVMLPGATGKSQENAIRIETGSKTAAAMAAMLQGGMLLCRSRKRATVRMRDVGMMLGILVGNMMITTARTLEREVAHHDCG